MLGRGKTEAPEEEGKNVSGANEIERLKQTDLSKLNDMDAVLLEEIARKMFKQMALRLRRRMVEQPQQGTDQPATNHQAKYWLWRRTN